MEKCLNLTELYKAELLKECLTLIDNAKRRPDNELLNGVNLFCQQVRAYLDEMNAKQLLDLIVQVRDLNNEL